MKDIENSDYQLVHMDEAERQELIEARRLEINEQFTSFNKRLYDKVQSYLGDTSNDIKMILALNSLLQREFNQHEAYSLEGFDQALQTVRDIRLLANNNFVYGDNTLATETAVYLVIEPEVIIDDEDGEPHLSNNEKIKRATEVFDLDGVDYKLYLFLNTDKYDIYTALEEDLRSSISRDYEIVSVFPNIDMREKADVIVDFMGGASVAEITDSFLTTLGLFKDRRNAVYFNYNFDSKTSPFGELDFLLLAHKYLPNLVMRKNVIQPLAQHFTNLWLQTNLTLKHRFEEIEDFFNSPSVVIVKGMSPVYGVITGRKMIIKGAKIDPDTGEENLVAIEINSDGDIGGLYNESELRTYLELSPKNLRDKLVRWKNDVIRVDSLEKTLIITGKNLNNITARPDKYTISGNLDAVTFLTPFYREDYYNNLLRMKNSVPYKLPDRFRMYLLRKAYYKGFTVPEVDSKWFSKANSSITEVLTMLSEKFHLDTILGYSISPVDGIVNKQILVGLEGLKCLTRER